MIRLFKSALLVNPECDDADDDGVAKQLESLFGAWDGHCREHNQRSQVGVAYTFYAASPDYRWAIDNRHRPLWGKSKPTRTFLVTSSLPDGRQWGNAKIAMEAVGVVGDCEKKELYLDAPNDALTYCHALMVENSREKIVFFSGVVALGSAWRNQPGGELDSWVISPEHGDQVYYCLRQIEELCHKAEITPRDVRHIDIFYHRFLDPSIIVKQMRERYAGIDLLLRPVDDSSRRPVDHSTSSRIIHPILVVIRPYAVVHKE